MKKDKQTWWERRKIPIIMSFIFVVGVVLIWVSQVHLNGNWQDILRGIGIASITAGILGLTIDKLFRQQLLEDAFKASVGYLLPDELKGEMEWIYNTRFLCIEHIQTCELAPINNDANHITIKVRVQRTFHNISSSRESLVLNVAIDEWFHKTESSKILSFGHNKEGDREDFDRTKLDCGISAKKQNISLAPSDEATVWYVTEEVKHINDVNTWVFHYATLNPQVTVKPCEGIGINVSFGYRMPAEQLGANTYRLPGTLLPGQRIEVRWWKISDSQEWLSEKAGEENID